MARRLSILLAALVLAGVTSQAQTSTFTLYATSGKRSVVVRGGNPEMVVLEQLAGTFGLTFTEDRVANGVVIGTRGDRIFAFPGQSFVRTTNRVIALSGPVQRDRSSWIVPIDFLTKALSPAIGEPIVIRRASKLILVGGVRVPEVGAKVEKTPGGAHIVISVQPPSPSKVTRDGNHLTVRFEVMALDAAPVTGFIPDFVPAAKLDGTSLVFDLGPSADTHRVNEDRVSGTITIDLAPPPPAPPPPLAPNTARPSLPAAAAPPGAAAPATPAPVTRGPLDLAPGALRTIVLDAGHGGEDGGAAGADGTKEKDVTLQIARRLKATIEGRLGLRVLLTREGDEDITLDRRTELANNNKADVFVSLHANWSSRPAARGLQIYSLSPDAYRGPVAASDSQRRAVPVVGGGTRFIETVPWDLAQLPFAEQSATLASMIERHIAERTVPMFVKPTIQAPMRILMGANMPAVLIELGFLSNADDAKALTSTDWQTSVIEGIVLTLTEVRRGVSGPTGLEVRR